MKCQHCQHVWIDTRYTMLYQVLTHTVLYQVSHTELPQAMPFGPSGVSHQPTGTNSNPTRSAAVEAPRRAFTSEQAGDGRRIPSLGDRRNTVEIYVESLSSWKKIPWCRWRISLTPEQIELAAKAPDLLWRFRAGFSGVVVSLAAFPCGHFWQ